MEDDNNTTNWESDSELLTNFVRNGDEAAFARIVDRYRGMVWGICQRRLANRADAEDAFQATFVLLATKARRIRNRSSLASWLYGVAMRVSRQTANRRRHESANDMELACHQNGPFDEIASRHERQLLDEQLGAIGEHHRAPLLMYYYQGMSYSEIAQQLGLTIAAVQGRLRRGRGQLRRRLVRLGIPVGVLGTVSVFEVPLRASCVAETIRASIGASIARSTAAASTYPLNSGAKLMLMKSITVAGLLGLGTVGALLQHGIFKNPPPVATALSVPVQPPIAATTPTVLVAQHDDDEQGASKSNSWWNMLHLHMRDLHQWGSRLHAVDDSKSDASGKERKAEIHSGSEQPHASHDHPHPTHLHLQHEDRHATHDQDGHSKHDEMHAHDHEMHVQDHGNELLESGTGDETESPSHLHRLHQHLGEQHHRITNHAQDHIVHLLLWMHGQK